MYELYYDIIKIFISILVIIFAGTLIEELVDWVSWKYKKSQAGVAGVFAPIITSLPELVIFTIAMIEGYKGIAAGSIIAQPFMVNTIVLPACVIVAMLAYFRKKRSAFYLHPGKENALPLLFFAIPLVPFIVFEAHLQSIFGKIYGIILVAIYFLYAKKMLRESETELEERKLKLKNVYIQTIVAILAIYFGSEIIVDGIYNLGSLLQINEMALSVLLIPLASAVPESIVGFIFISKGRDNEGINSIIGEGVLYGTFYPGIALVFGAYMPSIVAVYTILITVSLAFINALLVLFKKFNIVLPLGIAGYLLYVYLTLNVF